MSSRRCSATGPPSLGRARRSPACFHRRDDRIESEYLELGCRLRRAARGQGLASAGGRALLDHGFERVGPDRALARALVRNPASQRVMEICGLRRAGSFLWPEEVIAGRSAEERAGVKYAITRAEWLGGGAWPARRFRTRSIKSNPPRPRGRCDTLAGARTAGKGGHRGMPCGGEKQ